MVRSLLILLGLSLGAALQAQPNPGHVTLQLKWKHQFQFAGYYAAQEQGYYREVGLEVDLVEADPSKDPVKEVVEGRAQYGVGNSGLLLSRQEGQPVVVLAVIFQHSPFLLISRADVGIDSVHDLVGRKVMLEHHSEELLAYLKKEGVPVNALQVQPHSFDSMDLVRGKIEALSAYSSDEPFFLERAGLHFMSFTPRSGGIDFYGDNLFTTEAELNTHPARAEAFREASLKGWKYAMAHQEELIQLIHTRYGERHSLDHLRYEARQMVQLMRPELVNIGYMYQGRWQHIADTYSDLGLLPPTFSLAGFLYDRDEAARVAQRRLKLALTLVLPLAVVLGALTLLFLHLNRRLRRSLLVQAELAATIQVNERRFRFIAEHAADVIWTMDIPSQRFTYMSPSALQLRGYPPEEILAQPVSAALSPESAALLQSDLLKSLAEWKAGHPVAPRVMELDQPHRDGRLVPTEAVTTLHPNAEGQLVSVLGISRDITERRRTEQRLRQELQSLEQLASTDPLTLAWNRRHFEEVVVGEIHRADRYGHPLTMLLLDIDHFKRVNDTFGHAEGDRVLRGVADCIRAAIRVSDSLTRWGGEEFIVLMPNTGLSSASTLAERIREGIAGHTFEGIGQITASIGLAEHLPSTTFLTWMERTDKAMYLAKHEGRNRVVMDEGRRRTLPTTEHLEGTFLKLVWNPVYQCGNPTIDTEHEHLFRRVNDLLDGLFSGRPADEINSVISHLLSEVVLHFHDEEAILRAKAFPGLDEHAKLHGMLTARAVELTRAFQNGTTTLGSLFQFLAHDVVAQHLLKADREFFHLMAGDRSDPS